MLMVGVTWRLNVLLNKKLRGFRITLHDNFLHKTNVSIVFIIFEALNFYLFGV